MRRFSAIRIAVALLVLTATAVLSACSSGNGGSNGVATPRDEVDAQGLNFSYPYDGQLDVVLDTRIVINFPDAVAGAADDALTLEDANGNNIGPDVTVVQNDKQPNILRLNHDGVGLRPNTDYRVVATSDLSAGNTQLSAGDVLFSFRTRPLAGRPANGDFAVTSLSPGERNDLEPDSSSKFTQFNAIRVVLNEPVNPATVTDDSFIVTGPNGNQITTGSDGNTADARLTALGRYIVFDPVDDLAPGRYTIEYTNAITSVFGKSLDAGSKTRNVLSVGEPIDEQLVIEDDTSATDLDDLDDDFLGGAKVNNVRIMSQLIGTNNQPVIGPDDVSAGAEAIRNRIDTTLAEPGQPGFGNVIPAVIRAGQKFQLKQLSLALDGGIPTPVVSGPIDVNFINDVDVYLQGSDYRTIETPTAVRLRLDLGIGTLITAAVGAESQSYIIQQLANGVFNQSVLNIQAAGLAIPRANGDLEISALGTFDINVNRTDNATVNFGLTLVLPADPDSVDDGTATDDGIAPLLTAQSPSACLYAFGSPAYDSFYTDAAPTVFPEPFCAGALSGDAPPDGGLGVAVNSFPVEASPAITFSAPIDPTSISAASIQLTGNGNTVPATYRAEGFSVVVDPLDPLAPDTDYRITLNAGSSLTDLAGNAVTSNNPLGPGQPIGFTTEPLVDADAAPALLGTLTPGVPCALAGGDFAAGGNNAGNCVNSSQDNAAFDYPVFTSPINVPVDAVFSKFVDADSIKLADGCLTAGSGDANRVNGASVALQEMDGGQCVGTPDAAIALANPGDDITRAFTIRPVKALANDTRYWIVVCGADGTRCANGNTITDVDGLALNTDPLAGTGSTPSSSDAEGGPDILMPFDTERATDDYYTLQFTLPETDTNGNGRFDEGNGDDDSDSDGERAQPGNRSLVSLSNELTGTIPNDNRADGKFANYLGLARPIAIRQITDQCDRVAEVADDDSASAIGNSPDNCILVSLLPGGFNSLSAISASLGGNLNIDTGRVILRFPNDSAANATGQPTQTGYIVAQCQGTLPAQTDADGDVVKPAVDYDFEPCFAASLDLVANAPDSEGLTLDQQRFTANVVGPVTFEQNGRLVISLRSVNTIVLEATALNLSSAATIAPGDLNFQLVGNATHGGRAFPNR